MNFFREGKIRREHRAAAKRSAHFARRPEPVVVPEEGDEPIRVSRTLVKSKPELAELIKTEPRLRSEGIQVSLIEKGFGTRVAIAAHPRSELGLVDMESILDRLAEPQKRPFTGT
jgi:hypothetical protein